MVLPSAFTHGRGISVRGCAVGRTDCAGHAEQRNSILLQRDGKVGALIFDFAAIELGHDAIQQDLLFSIRADADLALLVVTLAGPYG